MELHPRHRDILYLLWREQRLSRFQIHQATGLTPNIAGGHVARLIAAQLVREGVPHASGPGRPSIPVEIDPEHKLVLGVAIRPGGVEVAKVNLRGELVGRVDQHDVKDPSRLIFAAAKRLGSELSDRVICIGISITGFVDPERREVVFSSSLPGRPGTPLAPLYETAGHTPVIMHNDMHSLAARWVLTHQEESSDVLLTRFADGAFGGAMLIAGRPNAGCAYGGNEIGHMRLPVETDLCFCGHQGCLERIVSSEFLRQHGAKGTLQEEATRFVPGTQPMQQMLDLLSLGLANTVNFVRPNRLVLNSQILCNPVVAEELTGSIRRRLLPVLAERVKIDVWDQPATRWADTAAWLALANLYLPGWD